MPSLLVQQNGVFELNLQWHAVPRSFEFIQ
jgi:hypothetical protein